MKEPHPLVVLLFQLALDALILHELQLLLLLRDSLLAQRRWHLGLLRHLCSHLHRGVGLRDRRRLLVRLLQLLLDRLHVRVDIGRATLIVFRATLIKEKLCSLLVTLLLVQLLLLNVVTVVRIEDDLLDLFFRQQTREKVAAAQRIRLVDILATAISVVGLCILLHILLQHQEVHDLVVHGQRICTLRQALHTLLEQLVGSLLSVDLERLDSLAEHADLLEDAGELCLERLLEDLERRLLLELSLLETVQSVEAEAEELAEQPLGRPSLVSGDRLLEVTQYRLLAVVIDDQVVALVEAGIQDARQD